MACFLVPLSQAVVTTVIRKSKTQAIEKPDSPTLLRHLPALEKMLWGGSVMLIVDHIVNGELTWRFPFLSALATEGGGWGTILHEMLYVGVPMSIVLTLVWIAYALIKESRKQSSTKPILKP